MADSLTFLMGKYAAILPARLRYCPNHMWCRPGAGMLRFGFGSYAVRLMQDVYFLDWLVNPGDNLAAKQQIGHIETSKAVADLFAPLAGTLTQFNDELLKDPAAINVDTYGAGWLFEMAAADEGTMTAEEYVKFLEAGWEKTQNMLKGHM